MRQGIADPIGLGIITILNITTICPADAAESKSAGSCPAAVGIGNSAHIMAADAADIAACAAGRPGIIYIYHHSGSAVVPADAAVHGSGTAYRPGVIAGIDSTAICPADAADRMAGTVDQPGIVAAPDRAAGIITAHTAGIGIMNLRRRVETADYPGIRTIDDPAAVTGAAYSADMLKPADIRFGYTDIFYSAAGAESAE